MRKRLILFVVAFVAVTAAFNFFAYEINQFNAKLRVLVRTGELGLRAFDDRGLPVSRNARTGEDFVSPFYVVHYGLIYSDTCSDPAWSDRYHWREDPTVVYWNVPPDTVTKEGFRHAADWVVENLETDDWGNAHLYYDFDWSYKNLPGGKLTAPWWSGLTEGHALTLLLRASDCFGDPTYELAAKALYQSILTPVSEGGSLVEMNGRPWIEEYVDPRLPESSLSRVFNGMVYAYHGVRAYEMARNGQGMADVLENAIIANTSEFALGNWSYYDAIGSSANIKYHQINLALIEDERLRQTPELQGLKDRWHTGAQHAGFFYALHGELSVAKIHFLAFFVTSVFIVFLTFNFIAGRTKKW